MAKKAIPIATRLLSHVAPDGDCWRWTGSISKEGYGQLRSGGKTVLAHRAAYETFRGPVPSGMDLDHLCRNRWCVNAQHLEVVTRATNLRRGMHPNMVLFRRGECARGHPRTEENVVRNREGGIAYCRICRNIRRKERYWTDNQYRKREKAKSRSAYARRDL